MERLRGQGHAKTPDRFEHFVAMLAALHPTRELVSEEPLAGRFGERTVPLLLPDVSGEVVQVAIVKRPQAVASAALRLEPKRRTEEGLAALVQLQ
jgi:hypothetical protein